MKGFYERGNKFLTSVAEKVLSMEKSTVFYL